MVQTEFEPSYGDVCSHSMNKHRLSAFLDVHAQSIVWGLIGLVLVAGAIYAWWLGDRLRYIDEQDYFTLAENLIRFRAFTSDGIHPAAFRPPGYPFFLAALRIFGAPIFALRMLNFLALAGIIMLLQCLSLRLFQNRSISMVTAALPLCYPVLFYTAGALYPQIIGAFLLLFVMFILSNGKITTGQLLLAGVATSGLILIIPAMGFIVPVFALWVWLRRHSHHWRDAILISIIGLLLPAVWSVRNRVLFSEWVFVSANSGLNLFLGNSEGTTPNSGVNVPHADLDTQTATMNDVQRDGIFRDAGQDWIQAHPTRAAVLYLQKLLNHFNYRNDLFTQTESSSANDAVMFATFYPLLTLATMRLLFSHRLPITTTEGLVVIIYVLGALTTAVFFTRIRFRLPFDVLLFIMVSGLLAQVQKSTRHTRRVLSLPK